LFAVITLKVAHKLPSNLASALVMNGQQSCLKLPRKTNFLEENSKYQLLLSQPQKYTLERNGVYRRTLRKKSMRWPLLWQVARTRTTEFGRKETPKLTVIKFRVGV